MRRYLFPAVALVCLAGLPVARAAEEKAATPTVVIRLDSINGLLVNLQYLASLSGQEEQVKQFQGMLKEKTGEKGFQGIDPTKPLGFYANVGPQGADSTAVLLVPVSDEKAFVTLLEGFNVKVEKGKEGLYTLSHESAPLPGYMRFANGYAYITAANEAAVDKDALLAPEKVLPAGQGGTASAVVRIDQIPDQIKQLALGQLSLRLADLKDKPGGYATEAEKQWESAFLDDVGKRLKEIIRDGKELSVRLNVDRDKGELSVALSLDGKPSSSLMKDIGALGQGRSEFAGLMSERSAMQGLVHATLPEDLRKALGPEIDEALTKALAKEQDKEKREHAEEFFQALKPTLKSGDLDLAFALSAPASAGKHHTLVAAIKVKDGQTIDKAFRDAVKGLPEKDRERIKLDAEKVGDVPVHRLEAQKDFDPKARQSFGDNPVYLAIRNDALFIALGDNGPATLKQALAAEGGAAPPFRFDIFMARMVPAIAIEHKGHEQAVEQAAQEAFGKEQANDLVSVTLEGGSQLRGRLLIKGPVLKFISLVEKADKAEKGEK